MSTLHSMPLFSKVPAQCCKSSSETGRSIQIEVDAFAELYSKHCINSAIPSVLQAAAWFYSPQKPASARFLHAYAPLLAKPSVRPIATATHGLKTRSFTTCSGCCVSRLSSARRPPKQSPGLSTRA